MALTKAHKARVGNRDKRVDFENYVESGDDGLGGSTGSWQTEATLWASITPVSGKEKIHIDAIESNITHTIELRYSEFDINAKTRIVWNNRNFNLHYVIDKDEENAYWEIAAVEQQ